MDRSQITILLYYNTWLGVRCFQNVEKKLRDLGFSTLCIGAGPIMSGTLAVIEPGSGAIGYYKEKELVVCPHNGMEELIVQSILQKLKQLNEV